VALGSNTTSYGIDQRHSDSLVVSCHRDKALWNRGEMDADFTSLGFFSGVRKEPQSLKESGSAPELDDSLASISFDFGRWGINVASIYRPPTGCAFLHPHPLVLKPHKKADKLFSFCSLWSSCLFLRMLCRAPSAVGTRVSHRFHTADHVLRGLE